MDSLFFPSPPIIPRELQQNSCFSNCRGFSTQFYFFINIISSLGFGFINKLLFHSYGFKHETLLTTIHFGFIFVVLEILRRFGKVFEPKVIISHASASTSSSLSQWWSFTAFKQMLPLSVTFIISTVCTTLLMQDVAASSFVGFFQLTKILTIPTILLLSWKFFPVTTNSNNNHNNFPISASSPSSSSSLSVSVKMALVVCCLGAAIGTVTDFQTTVLGIVLSVFSLIAIALYQILIAVKQKELGCSAIQLLHLQAPVCCLLMIPLVPILDFWIPSVDPFQMIQQKENNNNIDYSQIVSSSSPGFLGVIVFASCLLAFLMHLSMFLVIGKSSPVTYNVVGFFKMAIVLVAGLVTDHFINRPFRWNSALGIVITVVGGAWYAYLMTSTSKFVEAVMVNHLR